jgi:hypothetical protein
MFIEAAKFIVSRKGRPLPPQPSPDASRHPLPLGERRGEGAEFSGNPSAELSIHGQEKVAATVALCRMNLAMHGLEGDIREAITYYDGLHESPSRFDFVLANPPFNVNAVDKERLKDAVGPRRRFPSACRVRTMPTISGFSSFTRRSTTPGGQASSWPTPLPMLAPRSRSYAASSSKPAPWT